jgi:4-amino-4-deoxychorismate lyase
MNIIVDDVISSKDRGLQYGDGFFTTVHVQCGRLNLWKLHLERLKQCSKRLYFPTIDWLKLTDFCTDFVQTCDNKVLKIVVTRGQGGRGYSAPTEAAPVVILYLSDYPKHYRSLSQQGLHLDISTVKLGHQPLFAGLKTLNRLEQVLIKQHAQKLKCDDVVVLDIYDNVIESSVGNIIAIKNGQAFTPKLSHCGIKGVYLQHLEGKNKIRQREISITDLLAMDAVFVCNSLMKLIHVNSIHSTAFESKIALSYINQLDSGMVQ